MPPWSRDCLRTGVSRRRDKARVHRLRDDGPGTPTQAWRTGPSERHRPIGRDHRNPRSVSLVELACGSNHCAVCQTVGTGPSTGTSARWASVMLAEAFPPGIPLRRWRYYLWRFLIDARFQGSYGRARSGPGGRVREDPSGRGSAGNERGSGRGLTDGLLPAVRIPTHRTVVRPRAGSGASAGQDPDGRLTDPDRGDRDACVSASGTCRRRRQRCAGDRPHDATPEGRTAARTG